MSGPRLAGRLSRTRPSLRLLYLTELPDDRVRQQGVDPARTLERSAPTELLLSRVRLALDEPADDA